MKRGGVGVVLPFVPFQGSAPFAELPTALCWDRASGGSQPLWCVGATMRRAQGRLVCKGPSFVGGGGTWLRLAEFQGLKGGRGEGDRKPKM